MKILLHTVTYLNGFNIFRIFKVSLSVNIEIEWAGKSPGTSRHGGVWGLGGRAPTTTKYKFKGGPEAVAPGGG